MSVHPLRATTVGTLLILAMLSGNGSSLFAEEHFIRFLDDLLLMDTPDRDPWEERIETDRHDFTQSPRTIGRLVAQIESGYTYFYMRGFRGEQ